MWVITRFAWIVYREELPLTVSLTDGLTGSWGPSLPRPRGLAEVGAHLGCAGPPSSWISLSASFRLG